MRQLFLLLMIGLLFANMSFATITSVTLNTPSEGAYTNNTPSFTFTPLSDSDATGIACPLDIDGVYSGVGASYTGPAAVNGSINTINTAPFTTIPDGAHNWTVRCSDPSDSTEVFALEVRNFTADGTPPTAYITYPIEGLNLTSNVSIPLNFTAFDSGSGLDTCYYILDNGPLVPISCGANTTFDVSSNVEGHHDIYLRVNDSAGNLIFTSTINFSIDLSSPNVTLNSPANNTYSSSAVDFNFTMVDSNIYGIANCSLFLNGGIVGGAINSSTLNNTPTVFSLGSGDTTYDWLIMCVDPTGHAANSSTRRVTYDSTAPSINLTSPVNNSAFTSSSVSFNFNVSDVSPTTNCSVLLDGVSVGNNSSVTNLVNTEINFTNVSVGSHNWSVSCIDLAGNTGNSGNYSFQRTNPVVNPPVSSGGSSSSTSQLSVSLDMQCNNNTITTNVGSVSVNVVDEDSGSSIFSSTTDLNGEAMFNSCGRTVRVYVNKAGYRSTDERFVLDSCSCMGPRETVPTTPVPTPTPNPQPTPPVNNTPTPNPTPQPTPGTPGFTGPSSGMVGSSLTFSVTNCDGCSVRVEGPDGRTTTLTVTNGQVSLPVTMPGNYRLSLVRNGEVVSSLNMAATAPSNTTPTPSPEPTPEAPAGDNGMGFAIWILIILLIGGVAYYYYVRRRK